MPAKYSKEQHLEMSRKAWDEGHHYLAAKKRKTPHWGDEFRDGGGTFTDIEIELLGDLSGLDILSLLTDWHISRLPAYRNDWLYAEHLTLFIWNSQLNLPKVGILSSCEKTAANCQSSMYRTTSTRFPPTIGPWDGFFLIPEEEMPHWIEKGRVKRTQGALQYVYRTNDQGQETLIAQGFEWERKQKGRNGNDELEWSERVLVLRSPTYAAQQEKGLEQRLEKARTKIRALTPARGRGKRQITEETVLKTQIETILTTHKIRRSLKGVFPGSPKRTTQTPTVERMLKAFANVTLTIIQGRDQIIRHLTGRILGITKRQRQRPLWPSAHSVMIPIHDCKNW